MCLTLNEPIINLSLWKILFQSHHYFGFGLNETISRVLPSSGLSWKRFCSSAIDLPLKKK